MPEFARLVKISRTTPRDIATESTTFGQRVILKAAFVGCRPGSLGMLAA